ncbi:hypothetical protein ACFR99_01550 [Haloarchaeobius amylolyticus]|uniref:Uncharacterized protein n=1 Tax=Haloarchaeobius amylolyticus TaxID=1198296 RepID=A0ABD6BB62_9EURY
MKSGIKGLLSETVSIFKSVVYEVFPPIEHCWETRKIDYSQRVSENQEQKEEFQNRIWNALPGLSGDIDDVRAAADNAHQLELDRSSEIDSKAATYLGNVGVVLSLLSLLPVLAVVLRPSEETLITGTWPDSAVLVFFGYAVVSFLLSAVYSTKTMEIAAFDSYYSASSLKSQIEDDEFGKEDQVVALLTCRKKNEEYTIDKLNTLSTAEALNRNGLIGLGFGITTAVLLNIL